jgi:hypothetical protein
MNLFRVRNYKENLAHEERMKNTYAYYQTVENNLIRNPEGEFFVNGFSYPAGQQVDLLVDYNYSDGKSINWRERVVCPVTQLNNRLRATYHIFQLEASLYPEDKIYISEQVTPFYQFIKEKYKNVVGSEFLGDKIKFGTKDKRGVRNEDLSNLTFESESFDRILSLDCFEHFPEFNKAFSECCRVLKKGGSMVWSVPFNRKSEKNIIRASVNPSGEVVHHLEPEYHGDPINDAGCLCFTHFGWEMLDNVRSSGFSDAYAVMYWSKEFGYLGGEQILFVAVR